MTARYAPERDGASDENGHDERVEPAAFALESPDTDAEGDDCADCCGESSVGVSEDIAEDNAHDVVTATSAFTQCLRYETPGVVVGGCGRLRGGRRLRHR